MRTDLLRLALPCLTAVAVSACTGGSVPPSMLPGSAGTRVGRVVIERPDGTRCAPGSKLELGASVWDGSRWQHTGVIWKSSKPAVATVDSQGRVTCGATGQATVSASLPDGSTDKAVVVVSARAR